MGIYDEVTIEYPLPDGYAFLQSNVFQTRSFDNFFAEYHITKEGKILCKDSWGLGEDAKYEPVEPDYHGYVYIYELLLPEYRAIEFRLKFTDGLLIEIKVHEDRIIKEAQ